MNNVIIFLPSGEIYNCTSSNKYNFFILGFAKYKEYINGIKLDEYISRDILKEDIYNLIKEEIKIGLKINCQDLGNGYIQGIMENGWILNFNEKKRYVSTDSLIKNLKYNFIE